NAIYLRMFTFTPAGGIGRTLWEGSWQVALPGRVQATLTRIADATPDRIALDNRVRGYADQVQMDSAPMLRYVHQWQDIRRIYIAIYLRMFTFTPAGGIGRTLWEGSWQVALPGRVQATLTRIADATPDRIALDNRVRGYADQVQMDSAPMLRYVHQWQDIRRI